MNWNFISVPSVTRCTLRFFLFFLFRGDSSSPRYVKKNSQELSFIIKLRHRFSLIRKLIKRFCNYACCPISQVFKRTDLRFSRNKEIRILLRCMDLNETLYHIAHPLRCLVLLSLFFFSFSFTEPRQFLVVKKNKTKQRGRALLSNKRELFLITVFIGHCREGAVVERLKQEWMYGLSAKKNGRCGEVTVSGGSTVFRNSSECLIQISTTLHNLNLTSTNTEKPNEFSSLQSKGVATKWTLKD